VLARLERAARDRLRSRLLFCRTRHTKSKLSLQRVNIGECEVWLDAQVASVIIGKELN
jgi:hypothetical protein